jgi:cytidyltransferase-like protein
VPLTVGLANGCYDLLHPGHVAMLEEAAEHCDRLVVAVDDDARIAATKGTRRPTRDYMSRALMVAGLRAVTAVLPISADQSLEHIMGVIRPDTYFCRPDAPEARQAQILGINVWRLERHGPWSTSEELRAIRGNPDRA